MIDIFSKFRMKLLVALIIFMFAQSCLKLVTEKGTKYELSLVCESKMRALEIRDYNTNKLKKYVTLPACQSAYTYNVTAIPGSRVILYCYNSLGAPGGGGCIKSADGTYCVIWRSWEGIQLNFCNYEYRTIYGAWYYLYKLKSYSCLTTYGFYTTLPNKYYCKDSSVNVIANSDDHDFDLDDYISYAGDQSWGVYTVFKSGVDYVTYDDGCKEGTKVATYYAHDIDQDYEFYSTIPGLYAIEWSGYGDWEYYQAKYQSCYYYIRVCYHTCGGCDSTTQGDSNNHRCTKCKGSRYFKHGTKNCYSKDEIDEGYYYDCSSHEWVGCYSTCGTCTKLGNATHPYCKTCSSKFPYLISGNKCVNNTDGYYYDNKTEKYLPCHSRCGKCSKAGTDSQHNCDDCAKDSSGNYLYHFTYQKVGQCITESEKPEGSFLNTGNNTYILCGNGCSSCSGNLPVINHEGCWSFSVALEGGGGQGEKNMHIRGVHTNKVQHISSGVTFQVTFNMNIQYVSGGEFSVVSHNGNVLVLKRTGHANGYLSGDNFNSLLSVYVGSETNKNNLQVTEISFLKCDWSVNVQGKGGDEEAWTTGSASSSSSSSSSTSSSTQCSACRKGYHFYKGVCVKEGQQNCTCYLDEKDDTYKECYETCGSCKEAGTKDKHNCLTCKKENGKYLYHFIYNKPTNCIPESEKPDDTYLNDCDNTYKKCHDACATCNGAGSDSYTNCKKCANGYYFVYWKKYHCVKPGNQNCTCVISNNTYVKCYDRCASCDKSGDSNNHNCKTCATGYHFVYNKEGQCILPSEKPDDTYLDEDDDTYKKCYETCNACSGAGNAESHKCTECLKKDGKYVYHFYGEGQCISEQPNGTYLDNGDNTYKECYKSCASCSKAGTSTTHNCNKCATGYHFIYSKAGNCIPESEKPDNTYYDEEDDTYKKCYSKCATCKGAGNSTNPNCKTCPPGYHFVYSKEGVCVAEGSQNCTCYLDGDDDTYKKCYKTCAACSQAGTSKNHYCTECAKDSKGNYKYHFASTTSKNCVEKGNDNQYLDESDNTYKDCYSTCAKCSKVIKIVIQLVLNVLKVEAQQVIIVIHVLQDLHLNKIKDQIVIKLMKLKMDIIMMKTIKQLKNVMILVQNVQENQHVLDVLQDITLFIINLVFVLLKFQMIAIMMKKMIHIKNVMINVQNVLKKEMIIVIIVQFVLKMKMEYSYIISVHQIQEIVLKKEMIINI